MIRIYKTCENPDLYSAEDYSYPGFKLLWQTEVSLPFDDLNSLLLSRGQHQTDIYVAKQENLLRLPDEMRAQQAAPLP